jgi:hypothetical protein
VRLGLATSVDKAFHRNGLREVHPVIDRDNLENRGVPSLEGQALWVNHIIRSIMKKSDRKCLFLIRDYKGTVTKHFPRWGRKSPPSIQKFTYRCSVRMASNE